MQKRVFQKDFYYLYLYNNSNTQITVGGNGEASEKQTNIIHEIMFICTDIFKDYFQLRLVLLGTTISADSKVYQLPGVNLTQIRERAQCDDGENLESCIGPGANTQPPSE